jgi:hypothetical protein
MQAGTGQIANAMAARTAAVLHRRNSSGRVRTGAIALAMVAQIGLLIVFVRVLAGSVAQAEFRRHSIAEHANATWRCRIQPATSAREACLAQLRPARTER